jgi:hypothetical protein
MVHWLRRSSRHLKSPAFQERANPTSTKAADLQSTPRSEPTYQDTAGPSAGQTHAIAEIIFSALGKQPGSWNDALNAAVAIEAASLPSWR